MDSLLRDARQSIEDGDAALGERVRGYWKEFLDLEASRRDAVRLLDRDEQPEAYADLYAPLAVADRPETTAVLLGAIRRGAGADVAAAQLVRQTRDGLRTLEAVLGEPDVPVGRRVQALRGTVTELRDQQQIEQWYRLSLRLLRGCETRAERFAFVRGVVETYEFRDELNSAWLGARSAWAKKVLLAESDDHIRRLLSEVVEER